MKGKYTKQMMMMNVMMVLRPVIICILILNMKANRTTGGKSTC